MGYPSLFEKDGKVLDMSKTYKSKAIEFQAFQFNEDDAPDWFEGYEVVDDILQGPDGHNVCYCGAGDMVVCHEGEVWCVPKAEFEAAFEAVEKPVSAHRCCDMAEETAEEWRLRYDVVDTQKQPWICVDVIGNGESTRVAAVPMVEGVEWPPFDIKTDMAVRVTMEWK